MYELAKQFSHHIKNITPDFKRYNLLSDKPIQNFNNVVLRRGFSLRVLKSAQMNVLRTVVCMKSEAPDLSLYSRE